MKRYLPLVISILANLGGGATGVGIVYLLGLILPAFGGEARQFDRDFLQPFLLGWAVSQSFFHCASAPTRTTAALALPGMKSLEIPGPGGGNRGRAGHSRVGRRLAQLWLARPDWHPGWPGWRAARCRDRSAGIQVDNSRLALAGEDLPSQGAEEMSEVEGLLDEHENETWSDPARRKIQRPLMTVVESMPMDGREPMSSVDRAWLMMDDPTNPMVINGFWIFEELLQYEHVLAVLEERLLIHARFRQRVVEHRGALRTRAYWEVDPAFELRAHVGRIVLPEPGDRKTLNETVARLLIDPLDLNRPLWKFTLIEGYGDGSVFFGRIHHCIGDGAALVKVLLSLADESVEGARRAPVAGAGLPQEKNPPRPLARTAARPGPATLPEGRKRGRQPANLLSLAARGGQLAGKLAAVLAKLALMTADDKTAFKGAVGVGKAVAWSRGILLDDVKFVKNRMGATVNDVLVAAVAGALRRYVEARGDNPEGKTIRAMVPVDIRGPQDTKLTNRFALVYLSLPIGIADPIERLFATKRHMDAIKRSPEALVTYQAIAGLGVVSDRIARSVRSYYADKVSVVLTNVPGPSQKLYFAGKLLDTIVFWVPQSGSIGVGISIFSYGGQVNIGLITDRGLAPDPDTIVAAFQAEFDDLLCLARVRET